MEEGVPFLSSISINNIVEHMSRIKSEYQKIKKMMF